MYWPPRKRSPKRLIVLLEPKKWRGSTNNFPPPPHFQIGSDATGACHPFQGFRVRIGIIIHNFQVTDRIVVLTAAEMESRIADLTTISDCMSTRLGQAERSLRDLNLTSVDDGMHVTTMRRRPTATDFAWSDDDDDDDVKMRLGRCHRRTSSTKRVCCTFRVTAFDRYRVIAISGAIFLPRRWCWPSRSVMCTRVC